MFEVRFADVLAWFVDDAGVSGLMTADTATFNDDQAAIRHDWPVERIVTEYRDAVVRVMTLAARVPSERWTEVGTIPWYGPGYAMDDLLVYSMYGHKREHRPQLEAILDRPGGLNSARRAVAARGRLGHLGQREASRSCAIRRIARSTVGSSAMSSRSAAAGKANSSVASVATAVAVRP